MTWDDVDLDGDPDHNPPIPMSIRVRHSVRRGGDTKTRKSRRTLALPHRCLLALRRHQEQQDRDRAECGGKWQDNGIVFASRDGARRDAASVRRAFRLVARNAGLGDTVTEAVYRHQLRPVFLSGAIAMDDIFGQPTELPDQKGLRRARI